MGPRRLQRVVRGNGAAAAPKSKRKKNACFQFSETQRCSFGDNCMFSYEGPAATEARVPAGGGSRLQRGDGFAGAGGGARGQRGDGSAGAGGQGGEGASNALVVRATAGGGARAWDGAQGGGSGRGAPGSG